MRLTILAGLIMGMSLAIQATLAARAKTKVGNAASGVRTHARVVAPWYIAMNDGRSSASRNDDGTRS
ncbi:MAG: hypothetical protein WCD12_21170 [Candidatus Binatus sp.]|jgi:hypothetical protein|uniref:hypothetical protein n=1 Tax=Candidatus Binatus sp. TaxID=2811406 RepID=UPI003C778CA8